MLALRPPRSRRRKPHRLRLETLEDRVVPDGNDFFANATVIAGNVRQFSDSGNNVEATGEVGEPNGNGRFAAPLNTVWWRWTPTVSGRVTLSTFNITFDTTLTVYTGSRLTALTQVAFNDDVGRTGEAGEILRSQVSFEVVAGTTYHMVVDGFLDSRGSYNFALRFTPAPPPPPTPPTPTTPTTPTVNPLPNQQLAIAAQFPVLQTGAVGGPAFRPLDAAVTGVLDVATTAPAQPPRNDLLSGGSGDAEGNRLLELPRDSRDPGQRSGLTLVQQLTESAAAGRTGKGLTGEADLLLHREAAKSGNLLQSALTDDQDVRLIDEVTRPRGALVPTAGPPDPGAGGAAAPAPPSPTGPQGAAWPTADETRLDGPVPDLLAGVDRVMAEGDLPGARPELLAWEPCLAPAACDDALHGRAEALTWGALAVAVAWQVGRPNPRLWRERRRWLA